MKYDLSTFGKWASSDELKKHYGETKVNKEEIREAIMLLEKHQPRTVADFEFRESEITRLREML